MLQQYPRLGLIFMGAYGETARLDQLLREHGLAQNSFVASDLDHGEFLATLAASKVYIRTPVVDGVSSSVLEALGLGIGVVASENGARPEGVMTYEDGNVTEFMQKVKAALDHTNGSVPRRKLETRDTLQEEIALLVNEA
ncbi:MAG: hypothetical protein ALAOOOJD_00907 [bacterium]|nr:hypothetical protein [bacterium]